MTALNPFLTVEEQLIEVTMLHMAESKKASQHAIELLKVGIPGAEKRIQITHINLVEECDNA